MEIIANKAAQYAEQYSANLDVLLQDIEVDTRATHPQAHMLSGQLQGKFLELISKMIHPKSILEVGTFTGFSALCLAKGLAVGGMLDTIELREAEAVKAKSYFERSAFSKSIRLYIGNALEIIPTLDVQYDLIFLDADKVNYINYYELTLPKLRKGGWLIADNVLFHGEVLESEIKGKNAKAIQAFNNYVFNDKRVTQVMLTIRDGLLLIEKL